MISVVQIRCTHCGAQGRMVLPPTGIILIGPCPQCKEMVAIFCGQALPLDTEIITHGSSKDKEMHLMSVLTDFIEHEIGEMVHKSFMAEETADKSLDTPKPDTDYDPKAEWTVEDIPETQNMAISEAEFSDFLEKELKLIDNPNYFRAIFG